MPTWIWKTDVTGMAAPGCSSGSWGQEESEEKAYPGQDNSGLHESPGPSLSLGSGGRWRLQSCSDPQQLGHRKVQAVVTLHPSLGYWAPGTTWQPLGAQSQGWALVPPGVSRPPGPAPQKMSCWHPTLSSCAHFKCHHCPCCGCSSWSTLWQLKSPSCQDPSPGLQNSCHSLCQHPVWVEGAQLS